MISVPTTLVQCDQMVVRDGEPERCRRADALSLPWSETSRASVRNLFMACHPGWWIGPESFIVFCPDCRRRAEAAIQEGQRRSQALQLQPLANTR